MTMLSRWQRQLRAHPRAIDVVVAVVPVFISFPGVTLGVDGVPVPSPRWPGYLVTGIACAALIWVRRQPHVVAVLTVACATTLAALGYTLSPLLLAPVMVAFAFVALRTSQKTTYAYTIAAIGVLLCTALAARRPRAPLILEIIGTAAWLLVPAALGAAARLRVAYAERIREEDAVRRVADERMRIARELHDVVAHHLALANAQVGTVMYLMDNDPAKARAMAGDLGGTIVSALEELKATVGVLRDAGDTDSPLEPAPGLAQLPGLAGSFRSAGLAVTITTEGESRPLPTATDLAAYRIIQEALTNITKHTTAGQAQVQLTYAGDRLAITVTNESCVPRPAATEPGYGLIGMRERALSVGGRLHAGPRLAGGFEVVTELPVHPGRSHEDQTQ